MKYVWMIMVLCWVSSAYAHDVADPSAPEAHVIPAALERSMVDVRHEGAYVYIESNGIPNHKTGSFPNRDNPNAITAQNHRYRVTNNPQKMTRATPKEGTVGVALNGIPFDPATAECYGRARGQRGPMDSCAWREEAIVAGRGKLGLDQSNAHVQPTGAYHYHGIPNGLLAVLPQDDLVHVGYAADGFKMVVSPKGAFKSGYRLKSGSRPSGPAGRYDGTYTADYQYVGGEGALDVCNGVMVDGAYVYVLTADFPYIPRCLMGRADSSFARRPPRNVGGRPHHPPRPY